MPEETPQPPETGHDQVDRVLAELDGLTDQPVADHHDRLARVHEALHAVLADETAQTDEAQADQSGPDRDE